MSAAARSVEKALGTLLFCCCALYGQYKAELIEAPPVQIPAVLAGVLEKTGFRIVNGEAVYCEIWFRGQVPAGSGPNQPRVTLAHIATGTFVGLIRFESEGSDRRGQPIQAGLYTLRYAVMPATSDHIGAAPQRDFLVLLPADEDQDPELKLSPERMAALSHKVSGARHPAVLSVWKADTDAAGFSQHGEDWVLETKLGDTPIALIVIGDRTS